MALVIDVGNALIKKNEIENAIEFVIDYGLENEMNETEALIMLLNYNLGDCENTLKIDDDKIIISSNTYVEGIFSNVLNIKGFQIESSYQGYKSEDKIIIEKIK